MLLLPCFTPYVNKSQQVSNYLHQGQQWDLTVRSQRGHCEITVFYQLDRR